MSNWYNRAPWEKDHNYWGNYKWEPNCSSVDDVYKKLDEKPSRQALGHMLCSFMTPAEIMEIFTRMMEQNTPCNHRPKISDVNKARLILLFPKLEELFPFEEFEENMQLALAFRRFDRFISNIDVNLLSRKQIKMFFEAAAADGDIKLPKKEDRKKPLQYLAKNMLPERMEEIFTVQMWREFIHHFPSKANLIDIKKMRNQTELRRFILAKPHIMRYQTVDDMKECIIPGPTWVRIIAKMQPNKRKHIPVGFKEWAKRDIFKEMLAGRKFKKFPDGWSEGLVDTE